MEGRTRFALAFCIDRCRPVFPSSRQFDDVRRKAKFMAIKIVPSTSNRGITPGPKVMASPIIHKRMASVKIVQNTALLLSWWLP
jgi:hypothetical protein